MQEVLNQTSTMLSAMGAPKSIGDDLNLLSENLRTYLPLIFLIFGLIGFIGNATTFLQPELRLNTCCLYLLCSSVIDIIDLSVNSFPNFLYKKYGLSFPWYLSSSMCKLDLFLLVFLPHLSINFVLMAIIDRFAATCSFTSPIRRLIQFKMVPPAIVLIVITSCLASIYAPILNDLISVNYCSSTQPTISSVLYILLIGLMQPIVMLLFVWLTYRNILRSRRRIARAGSLNANPRRSPFIMMIFAQVFTTAFFSLQWIVVYIYRASAGLNGRTTDQLATFYFIFYLTNNCYYLNNVKSFYLSLLTSGVFRQTLIRFIIKILPFGRRLRQQQQSHDQLPMTTMKQAPIAERNVATIEL